MIIKGNPRRDVAFWASHLMRTDHNERVTLAEIRGLAGQSVKDCLMELDAIAGGTRTKNGFYVASLNPRDDETLTAEQWERAADRLEEELGLTGQARFVVEHEKEGRTHRHVVWSRIDPDTMKAIPADFNFQKHEQAARAIEEELGLAQVESVLVKDRGAERKERRTKDWEGFRAAGTEIDPATLRAEITALWQEADSGLAFKAALEDAGYILARGDRRDFCVIDSAAHEHSLARCIDGAKTKDIRARMAEVDRDACPSVAEARQLARDAMAGSDGTTAAPEPQDTPQPPPEPPVAEITAQAEAENHADRELPTSQGDPAPETTRDTSKTSPEPQQAARGEGLPPYSRGGEAQFTPYECEAAASTEERDRGSEPDAGEEHTGWRRFADRVRAFLGKAAEQFGEYLRDEASGTPEEERGPWVRFIGAGRKILGGYFHHDGERLAEGLEEAKALAIQEALRRLDAAGPLDDGHEHAHHPPDEHHRDPSRPGVDVEPPEPDDRPQDGQETPLSAWADAAELWAWDNAQQAAESGLEGPEADSDPTPPELDGWDFEP